MNIFFAGLEQALIFTPLVLGVYISYNIIRVTDLTVDGTYVLGAVVFARMIEFGLVLALCSVVMAGIIVGVIVAIMQRHNIVNDLIVGVLASFMLYSINLQLLGRPNISLFDSTDILSVSIFSSWIIILSIIVIVVIAVLFLLLMSNFGLAMRAFGYNQKLLKNLGKSPEIYRIFALAISNSLAAFSGSIAAQVNGFADINMGFGIALIAIGAVVIGKELFFNNQTKFLPLRELFSCFIGILLYFICLNFLLSIGINPVNLKLILGVMLFLTLSKLHKKLGYHD